MFKASDAPGLKWRFNKDGSRVAYWACSGRKIHQDYRPRTVRLWAGIEPTSEDAAKIAERCRTLQKEMRDLAGDARVRGAYSRIKGVVYFIQSGDLVKIGFTKNLSRRFSSLQMSSPTKLTLLASLPGTRTTEHRIQGQFAKERSHGEWFFLSDYLRTFIERIDENSSRTDSVERLWNAERKQGSGPLSQAPDNA